MRFRLITLFKWTTAIAVVLALAMLLAKEASQVQGPRLVVWGRLLVVWGSIVGGAFLFIYWGIKGKPNDAWITYGLLLGIFVGVIVGNVTSLGEWMIDHFNPELPYRDFRAAFGSIAGGIIGAWFGALGGGILSALRHRKWFPL